MISSIIKKNNVIKMIKMISMLQNHLSEVEEKDIHTIRVRIA